MSRRNQFLLTSFLSIVSLPIVMYSGSILLIPLEIVMGFWLVSIVVIMMYVLERSYRFPEQLIFAIIPFIYFVTLLLVFSRFDLFSWTSYSLYQIIIYIGAIFSMYLLYLALNIVNAATVRTVPLLKAAQTTLLVFSVILSIVWAILIQSDFSNVFLAAWLWFIFSYLLSLAVVYLGQVEVVREFTGVIRVPLVESFVVAFLQAYIVFVTSGWYMTGALRSIYWVISLIVTVMIIRARRQRKLSKKLVRDFTLLQWAIFFAVLLGGIRFG